MWTLAETETDPTILERIQDALNYSDDLTRNLSFSLPNKRPPLGGEKPPSKRLWKLPQIYLPVVYSNDLENVQFTTFFDTTTKTAKRTGDAIFDAVSTDVIKGLQDYFVKGSTAPEWEVVDRGSEVLKHPELHVVRNDLEGIPVTAVLVSITKQEAEIVIITHRI